MIYLIVLLCVCSLLHSELIRQPLVRTKYGKVDINEYMIPASDGFCYISRVRAMSDSRTCNAELRSLKWYLVANSGSSDFECGITCVYVTEHIIYEEKLVTGKLSSRSTDLRSTADAICFLTSGTGWNGKDEICSVTTTTSSMWQLTYKSNKDKYKCGARCVSAEGMTFIKEEKLTGKGSGSSKTLDAVHPDFCWMSYGRCIKGDRERCHVQTSNSQWTLLKDSNQNDFGCGAMCGSFGTGSIVGEPEGRWNKVKELFGGHVEASISIGSERSDGKEVTTTWAETFSTSVSAGFSFLSATVNYTISESMAETISTTIVNSVESTTTVSCVHGERDEYTALYQWVLAAETSEGGEDVTYTEMYRCHYSLTSGFVPLCPPEQCGDTLCTSAKCLEWKA